MINILLKGGSNGYSTIFLPNSVRFPVLSKAPKIQSWYIEFSIVSYGGGSIKSNSSKLSTLRDFKSSTTLDKLVLYISGILFSNISLLNTESVYNLKHTPGPVLPALPALWLALAWDIGVIYNASIPIFGL